MAIRVWLGVITAVIPVESWRPAVISPVAVPVVFRKSNLSPADRVAPGSADTVMSRSPMSNILPSAVAMY